jgi:hypothetical protein
MNNPPPPQMNGNDASMHTTVGFVVIFQRDYQASAFFVADF